MSRILLAGIHLGWAMCEPPGRTLSQSDWPETTRNQSHHHKTLRLRATWRAVLLGSLTCCSPPRRPFPIKSPALSARVSPRTIHFWVFDKSPLLGSPSCNKRVDPHNYDKINKRPKGLVWEIQSNDYITSLTSKAASLNAYIMFYHKQLLNHLKMFQDWTGYFSMMHF